jgi:hypothetical protein
VLCLLLFSFVGMDWARYIVALGALMGIITTTLVSQTLPDICAAAAAADAVFTQFDWQS